MTLQSIIELIATDGGSWLILVVILMTLIQVTPIKVDPWSFIFNWFGNQINKDLYDKLTKLENKLDEHIKESTSRDIRLRRETILDFGNSCMNGRRHTREEFEFIISECDKYEKYCLDNKIINGVATATIAEIKRIYTVCLQDNSFLTGGQ